MILPELRAGIRTVAGALNDELTFLLNELESRQMTGMVRMDLLCVVYRAANLTEELLQMSQADAETLEHGN